MTKSVQLREKEALRKFLINRRSELGPSIDFQSNILNNIKPLIEEIENEYIGTYISFRDELDTKKGQDVRDMLKATLIGEQVVCQLNGKSSYDRLIGRCIAVDEGDIANYLIERGYCGRCKRYDEEGLYIEAQTKAGFYEGIMPNYCR